MKPTTQQRFVFLALLFVSANAQNFGNCSSCDLSTIQELMAVKLADTNHKIEQLQRTVVELQNITKYLDGFPKDCSEILALGIKKSGVYDVQPLDSGRPFSVYCDMETDSGGWTVFQRRKDGSVSFDQTFASYRQGFGNLDGEFWLGNENLHRLTAQDEYELRIELRDFNKYYYKAVYNVFSVGGAEDKYRLTIDGYSGAIGDAMKNHNGMNFTAKDQDNDQNPNKNCAQEYSGGWWYNYCYHANLNGIRNNDASIRYQGIKWLKYNHHIKFEFSAMKIRSKN